MPRASQTKRRDSNDLTHMFIITYRLTTAFERSLLGIRSGTVAETKYFILSHGSTALASVGLLYEVPRSIWDTPHSVTLLWKCDRPVTRWNEILTTQLITMSYLHQYGQFHVASKGCHCKILSAYVLWRPKSWLWYLGGPEFEFRYQWTRGSCMSSF